MSADGNEIPFANPKGTYAAYRVESEKSLTVSEENLADE